MAPCFNGRSLRYGQAIALPPPAGDHCVDLSLFLMTRHGGAQDTEVNVGFYTRTRSRTCVVCNASFIDQGEDLVTVPVCLGRADATDVE